MVYQLKISENDVFGKNKFVNLKGHTECVEFVRQATGAPPTSRWIRGRKVSSYNSKDPLARGSAIATFDNNGKYPNDSKGKHAAVYLSHDNQGIKVLDQWNNQGEVKQRLILFNRPENTKRSNNGDVFYGIN
jgi:hypothetical protein